MSAPEKEQIFPQIPQTSAEKNLRQSASSAGDSPAPKISVIVPVYKVEKYLPECIESVLAQTFTDFELILVDDGSPDNSGAICDAYAARDPRIRVFHKENGGVSSARNLGARSARAHHLAFLDSDDWWQPEFLEKMLVLAQRFPDCCCCCCCWYESTEKRSRFKSPFPEKKEGESFSLNILSWSASRKKIGILTGATFSFPICTGAVLVKRKEFEQVGGFKEGLVVNEDYALWFELALKTNIAYLNEPLAFYRKDTPLENKPRGMLPDLEKCWVTHLEEYDEIAMKLPYVRRFLDLYRIAWMTGYRGIPQYEKIVDSVIKNVAPKNKDWRFYLIYGIPTPFANAIIGVRRFLRKIF